MGENISQSSVDEKIKGLSDYLKSSVLDPAEKEKEDILKQAQEEKKRIIAEAEAEAEKIVKSAKEQAEHEKSTLESSLRIASKKAIDTLKISVEKEILNSSVDTAVKSAVSDKEIVKSFIEKILDSVLKGEESAEIILSDDMKNQLTDYIKSQVTAKAGEKLTLSDEKVPAGFALAMKESSIMFDFSEEALTELLSSFLRPEIRKYLFEN